MIRRDAIKSILGFIVAPFVAKKPSSKLEVCAKKPKGFKISFDGKPRFNPGFFEREATRKHGCMTINEARQS